MQQYLDVLKKYAVFSGRARRKEFWMFILVSAIISFLIGFVLGFIDASIAFGAQLIYSLAVLIPSIAVGARRLHDTGKSGWWQLIAIVPFIGAIVLIILFVLEGQRGDNKYGPDPKGSSAPSPAPAI